MSRLKGSGREGRNVANIGASKFARGPVDHYRRTLGKREVGSVTSKRERSALVHGSDVALQRSSVSAFFRSTPFLLSLLLLLLVGVSFTFLQLAQTDVVRMNQPPPDFAKQTNSGQIPFQKPQAIQY